MEINQSLENALILADIDFDTINNRFDNEFNGSFELYQNYAVKLCADFEIALKMLVLSSTPEKIAAFSQLNLKSINQSIKTIEFFEDAFSRNISGMQEDAAKNGVISRIQRPVQKCHYIQLTYIKKLFEEVEESLKIDDGTKSTQSNNTNNLDSQNKMNISDSNDLLKDYSELLSMKDMSEIFKVNRDAICKKEKAGHFKRCTLKNQKVMFEKEEIKRYLSARK